MPISNSRSTVESHGRIINTKCIHWTCRPININKENVHARVISGHVEVFYLL